MQGGVVNLVGGSVLQGVVERGRGVTQGIRVRRRARLGVIVPCGLPRRPIRVCLVHEVSRQEHGKQETGNVSWEGVILPVRPRWLRWGGENKSSNVKDGMIESKRFGYYSKYI